MIINIPWIITALFLIKHHLLGGQPKDNNIIITNFFSWLSDPGYAKSLAGFVQAVTVGLPVYSATPTWMFFRNSILSDLAFTCVFVLCVNLGRSSERSRATAALPRAA